MEWQLIETAPQDRSEILIFEKDKPEIASWQPELAERLVEAGAGLFKKEKYDAGYWQVGYGFSVRRGKPTHWLPLPVAPATNHRE